MAWKAIENWGRTKPVALAVVSLLLGLLPAGGIAGIGGYNLGFYAGTTTAENYWRESFEQKLREQVNSQVAIKCGQAVSEVNSACQQEIKRFEKTVTLKDKEIQAQDAQIEFLRRRSDILDLHERLVDSAQLILKSLLAAREKRDRESERIIKSRFFLLLSDIRRLNQIYMEWGSLFNGRATEMTQRYKDGESIPAEEIITYLESFSADADRKRKVIQGEVDEANKIKSKKY